MDGLAVQTRYLVSELKSNFPRTWSMLKSTKSGDIAARMFHDQFEFSNDYAMYRDGFTTTRVLPARAWYAVFANLRV